MKVTEPPVISVAVTREDTVLSTLKGINMMFLQKY